MREPSDFFRWIMPYAPACADPVAEIHVISAAREWCEATRCWREKECFPVTGEEDAVLCVPPYASLFEIEFARFNEVELERVAYSDAALDVCGQPRQITQVQPQSVALAPRGECGTLTISMFLEPAQDADVLPDFLYESWGQIIAQGALGSLLIIPDQPFSNPGLAAYNAGLFQTAKDRNFHHNRRGQQRAPLRTKPQYF